MARIAAAGIGFLIGLMVFAVGREIAFAFVSRPALVVISGAVAAIGSLRWVDTTLVTGVAAVTAAALSIREIRRQVSAAAEDTQKQIDHSLSLQKQQTDAKRDAARVALPLALSSICEYAEISTRELLHLLRAFKITSLPPKHPLPDFPRLPDDAIATLKETVEFVEYRDRLAFAHLLRQIQILNSRTRGLPEEARVRRGLARTNIEDYINDGILVYAQASDLFDFARYETDTTPIALSEQSLGAAFAVAGIHGELRDNLKARARRKFQNTAG